MSKKKMVPKNERLTGKELELAATYFAVSNMGQEPDMTPYGIYEKFNELEREIQWETEDEEQSCEPERADWRKYFVDGDPYVYKEWPKIREQIKGLDEYLKRRW